MIRRAGWSVVAFLVLGAGVAVAVSREGAPWAEQQGATGTEELTASIAFFEKRLQADPENYLAASHLIDRYLLRFQIAADLADVKRAGEMAHALLEVTPERADALARLSSVHLTQHDFSAATEAAELAVRADSTSEAALAALFRAAMAAGRYGRAEAAVRKLSPERVAGRIGIAQWLSATGETDAAEYQLRLVCDALEQAAAIPQTIAWCLTELGGVHLELAGERAARALYRRALAVLPGYRGAVEGLADLAHARGDWEEAERLYSQVATDAHPDLYLRLAEVSRALGRESSAADYDSRFLRVAAAPGAEALYALPLAMMYARWPQTLDLALEVAEGDVARRSAVESYDVLAWVRFRRGEFREALKASDRARSWGAPSPTMDLHRALILESLGRGTEAAPLRARALHRPALLEPHLRLPATVPALLATRAGLPPDRPKP